MATYLPSMTSLPGAFYRQFSLSNHRTRLFLVSYPSSEILLTDSFHIRRPPCGIGSFNSAREAVICKAVKRSLQSCGNDGFDVFRVWRRWMKFIQEVSPGGSWWNLDCVNQEFEKSSAKPMSVIEALSLMLELIKDQIWILYLAIAALSITAISEISMPGIITTSIFAAQNGNSQLFYGNVQFLVFLCLTSGLFSGLRSGCFAIANVILVKRLRESVFRSLLFQDIAFFDSETVGDLTSRISADCQRLAHTIGKDIHLILRCILQGFGAFVNLMTLSWSLSLSSLVICMMLSAIFLVYGQYQRKTAMLAQDFTSSANEVAQETISWMRTVRAYGTETEEYQRYVQWLEQLASVGTRESVAYGAWNLSFSLMYRFTQVFAVMLGGMSILVGQMSAEQLSKYVLYCEWLIYAAWRMQDNMSSLIQSVGACEKVFRIMHLNPSCQFSSKGVQLEEMIESIKFVNVSFHYPSRNKVSILKNVDFSIESNEVTAIVGSSGSGKSTLINLLLHLYEPISGEIYINGVSIRRMDMKWLREKIGFVGEEPHLFHMDVSSNISYGYLKSVSQANIESATIDAYAHEFICRLPDGYDTIIDNNLLSRGQKQRIAISRALLRDPQILILDGATSALDAESESHIQELLLSFKKDSTKPKIVIVIAHRLSTIKAADKILVMDNGQVVEVGNHRELVRKNGLYTRLFKTWTDSLPFI